MNLKNLFSIEGKVALVTGSLLMANLNERIEGVKPIFEEKYPDIEIVDTIATDDDFAKGLEVSEAMLRARAHIAEHDLATLPDGDVLEVVPTNLGDVLRRTLEMLDHVFATHGVTVNVCHPGDVNSSLSNDLGFGGHESPDQGADTPVWLATDPVGQEKTGKYFEHRSESRDRFAEDEAAVEELYRVCLGY